MLKKAAIIATTTGICFGITCTSAKATSLFPPASDWSVNVTTLIDRGSPVQTTTIADISDGLEFTYNSPTGGSGVGTSERQYDFTTTAITDGIFSFDVNFNATDTGFFEPVTKLAIIKNGTEINVLLSSTTAPIPPNLSFNDVIIDVMTGDTFGVRTIAGNFDDTFGVAGTIEITDIKTVPEPSSLLGIGVVSGLATLLRKRI